MQDHPGAPGTARQEYTRTIVSTNDGGVATTPRAPGHDRPRAASSDAARHGRLSAASTAPGADVPPATTAGAPGQYCLSAAPRAPGHGRPLAITAGVSGHDRLSAVPPAADHDRSAVRHTMAPGQGRPRATSSDVAGPGRPCATPRAPGADVPSATAAGAPGPHRLRAVAIATVASPAGPHRLHQAILPRTPATPNTLTHPHAHRDTAHICTVYRRANRYAQSRKSRIAPLSTWWSGAGGEARHPFLLSSGRPPTTIQVHPAIQVPPHPRSCSTASSLRRKPQSSRTNE